MKDENALKTAIKMVKQREPYAVRVLLETSDQDYYGFVLNDVVLAGPDAPLLSDVDEDRLELLREDIWEHICNLTWGRSGVVGEDKGGYADIALYTAPAKLFRVLRHDGRTHTYATLEERTAAAARFAKRDGATVVTELWSLSHMHDDLNRGWACDGTVRAA